MHLVLMNYIAIFTNDFILSMIELWTLTSAQFYFTGLLMSGPCLSSPSYSFFYFHIEISKSFPEFLLNSDPVWPCIKYLRSNNEEVPHLDLTPHFLLASWQQPLPLQSWGLACSTEDILQCISHWLSHQFIEWPLLECFSPMLWEKLEELRNLILSTLQLSIF